jgi:excisionase family DNA binding protein
MTEAQIRVRQTAGQKYMTTDELAALVRVPSETVRGWRHRGIGPKSFRVPGGRRILYDCDDVEAWLSEAKAGEVA